VTALQPEVAPGKDQAPTAGPYRCEPVDGPADSPVDSLADSPIDSTVDTAAQPIVPDPEGQELAGLARSHESIATLLASGGQWRLAYEHLRTALELHHASRSRPVHLPEQLRREVDRLRREHAEAREESIRDSLTASYNRRYLDERLVTMPGSGTVGRRPAGLGVALVDLDWFKHVNDTFGHRIGDRVLQRVVELLCTGLPDGAFCARYGGEEFVLVMPDVDAPGAITVSEAARARVEAHAWHELAPGLRVTISAGVAHEGPATAGLDAEQQLLEADALLYAAKQAGRNAVAYQRDGRVCLAGAAAARRAVSRLRAAGG
jgi:two-component system, cell cycle response regulator